MIIFAAYIAHGLQADQIMRNLIYKSLSIL